MDTKEEAKKWIKSNIKEILQKFANVDEFPSVENPFTIFMAGSPGAGKTEFSKVFIQNYDSETKIVRIDADEIRDLIPQYKEGNAYKVQGAAALGVEKLFDHVQKYKQNAILDGTFSDLKISLNNVKRALNRNRKVGIMYIYQDPKIAWEFTKKREKIEGRHVSKEMFIDSYFKAMENVNLVKQKYGKDIEFNIAIKDYQNNLEKTHFNIEMLDSYIKNEYTKGVLERILQ